MTRFARASGSKASNEKTPDDGTPWEVMKEQLLKSKQESEHAKKREEVEKQRVENYQNFLKEQKVAKRKADWCEFPESQPKKGKNEKVKSKKNTKENKTEIGNEPVDNAETNKINKKKKKNKSIPAENKDTSMNIGNGDSGSSETIIKKKKNKKASLGDNNDMKDTNNSATNQDIKNESKLDSDKKSEHISSQQKSKENKKKKKNLDGKRRKPIADNSFQLIINGKDVELVRFDGFPIMKKDADRLSLLKGQMLKKGIPKNEVFRTLKLERRRAEKALARMKKDVCYNCRKGGHNLSDCPELKSKIPGVDAADGLCFKCGSTEHRQFECKVQRNTEFRFASCFICKEQGHIARQCPDNPKGLYPNGGGCKLCGDVTHLRKDCPTTNDKKESSAIKLATIDNSDDIEGIQQTVTISAPEDKIRKPKKVTF